MALINCPGCGKQISDLASVCTYCGYHLKEPQNGSEALPAAEEPAAAAPAAADETKACPKGSFKTLFEGDRKLWWIIGGAVLLMAILTIILTSGKKSEPSSAGAPEAEVTTTETVTDQPAPNTTILPDEPEAGTDKTAEPTGQDTPIQPDGPETDGGKQTEPSGQTEPQEQTAGGFLTDLIRNGLNSITQNQEPVSDPDSAPAP